MNGPPSSEGGIFTEFLRDNPEQNIKARETEFANRFVDAMRLYAREYLNGSYHRARGLGVMTDDLVIDAYLQAKAYSPRMKNKRSSDLIALSRQMMKHYLNAQISRQPKRSRPEGGFEELTDNVSAPTDPFADHWELLDQYQAIDEEGHAFFVMRFTGWKLEEIASEFAIHKTTVVRKLKKCSEWLKRRIHETEE